MTSEQIEKLAEDYVIFLNGTNLIPDHVIGGVVYNGFLAGSSCREPEIAERDENYRICLKHNRLLLDANKNLIAENDRLRSVIKEEREKKRSEVKPDHLNEIRGIDDY